MLPQAVRYVLERLEDAGFAAYAVGGCVRDTLLGRTPSEANTVAVNAGLLIRFSGTTGSESSSVRVLSQSIDEGTEVEAGTVITVQLGDTSVTD